MKLDRIPGAPTRLRRALDGLGSDFVPYTGAIKDVDLGTFDLTTTGVGTFGTLIVNSGTIADDARGVSSITTLVTNAKSDGIAGYFEGHIDGVTDGPTYAGGIWLNVDSGSTTTDIRALDIGIYESGADCTGGNAYGLAIHMEFDSTNPPAAIYPFRLNTNVAGATPDALIFAANKKAIAVTEGGSPGMPNAYMKVVVQDGTVYRVPVIDENSPNSADLTTTGKGTFGELDVDTLNFNANVISDSTGTISFANEHLTTTGTISGVNVTSGADPGHTHGSSSITEADPLAIHKDGSSTTSSAIPFAVGLTVPDDIKIVLGDGSGKEIYSTGGNLYIINVAGEGNIVFITDLGTVQISGTLDMRGGGEIVGVGVLEVASMGDISGGDDIIEVYAAFDMNGFDISSVNDLTVSGDISLANNIGKLKLGLAADLEIFSDGTDSYVQNVNISGELIVRNTRNNRDLIFGIVDGGAAKTFTWDANVDEFVHSTGLFNLHSAARMGDGTANYMAVSATGDVTFVGTSGLVFAEIYANAVAADITSALVNDWDQITAFDTDGENNGATPDHTNDHITIVTAGKYLVAFHWCGHGPATAHDWTFHVSKNNGTIFNNLSAHVTTPTTQKHTSVTGVGIIDLAVSDTIELWVKRISAGNDIVLTTVNCGISLTLIGGT